MCGAGVDRLPPATRGECDKQAGRALCLCAPGRCKLCRRSAAAPWGGLTVWHCAQSVAAQFSANARLLLLLFRLGGSSPETDCLTVTRPDFEPANHSWG